MGVPLFRSDARHRLLRGKLLSVHVLTEEVKMLIAQIEAAKEEQIKEQILKVLMENSNLANNDSADTKN